MTGSAADIAVLARPSDGDLAGMRVDVSVGSAAGVELTLVEVDGEDGLFAGTFEAPTDEGDYLLTVAATGADGEQTLQTESVRAALGKGQCTATCYKRGRATVRKVKTTATGEFCDIYCMRFCFGPQGMGADELKCEFSPD